MLARSFGKTDAPENIVVATPDKFQGAWLVLEG